MKYVCFGYYDKESFDGLGEGERNAMFDACFAYDDHLRAHGHWVGGEALAAETALTVACKDGTVATTDGPYAETKEQLGGILMLEARDINHAVQLMAEHPAVKTYGNTFEIRAAGDLGPLMKASDERRRKEHAR